MPQYCRVCEHAKKKEIESLILAEEVSKKRIGDTFGMSETSVRNHMRHCMGVRNRPPASQPVAVTKEHGTVTRLEDMVGKLQTEAEDIGKEARKKKDLRTALLAIERQERLIHTMGNLALRKAEIDQRNERIRIEIVEVESGDSSDIH